MNRSALLPVAAAVIITAATLIVLMRSHDAAKPASPPFAKPPPEAVLHLGAPAPAPFLPPSSSPPQPAAAPRKKGKPPIQDRAARAALTLVGTDPTAELIWSEAINNPTLPPQERQDLIEDLNEDGLSNPARPSLSDLPLIRARIGIIDRLSPSAMDKTNADAFAEARKDLVNMERKLVD